MNPLQYIVNSGRQHEAKALIDLYVPIHNSIKGGMILILNFLGCGCAYRPDLGNTSAWFQTGGHLFLLDCGENSFTRIRQSTLLECCRDITVLITHSHADHIGSLPTLISYMHDVERKPVTLCFPCEDITYWMSCFGICQEDYRFLQGMDMVLPSGIRCHAVPVDHHPKIPCYGYHVTGSFGSFYYSGDARRLPPDILEAFLCRTIQQLYQDATFLEEQGNSHGSLSYLCKVIPPALRQHVYPMHFHDDLFEALQHEGFGCCMKQMPHH